MATNTSIPASIEAKGDESSKLKNKLPQLVADVQERLDEIKKLMAENPELTTVDCIDFSPTTNATKSVREAIFGIFNPTGQFIGRNSDDAVVADARVFTLSQEELFLEKYKGMPEIFISEELIPIADPDIVEVLGHAQVYFHPKYNIFKAFYASLANLRRRKNNKSKRNSQVPDLSLTAKPRKF